MTKARKRAQCFALRKSHQCKRGSHSRLNNEEIEGDNFYPLHDSKPLVCMTETAMPRIYHRHFYATLNLRFLFDDRRGSCRNRFLLYVLQQEIRRHDFNYFVHEPPSIAQGGRGVGPSGLSEVTQRSEAGQGLGLILKTWDNV